MCVRPCGAKRASLRGANPLAQLPTQRAPFGSMRRACRGRPARPRYRQAPFKPISSLEFARGKETMGGQAGRLAGKVALITGAASGIGRATAALFHGHGAKVAATDRNEAGLKTLGAHADLILVQDVTDEGRWRAVVDKVLAAFGRLDILVNSAGIAVLGNIETTTLADWRKVHAVNADGVFLGCREAVRAMKAGGGSIVNLSSVAGIIGDASSLAYCASKGAV